VPQDNNPYANPSSRYYALVLLTIIYSFNFIDRQLLAILQESIKADLNLSDGQLGLLTGFAFAVFYVTAGLPIARWADRGSRSNIVAASLFTWSFMTAISGFVQNYWHLLLARIGVGVGEAGGSPPSHSIISDIFPPEKRASAMGFYSTGVNIGILFGFLLGGWLNEYFGWRIAFIVVGAPGILLAVLVWFSLPEPLRGMADSKQKEIEHASFKDVISLLWQSRCFVFLALGASLQAFASYASSNWTASFIIRSFNMSTGELGTWLALTMGLAGAIGVFGGAVLADRLAVKDKRWYAWLPTIAGFICIPFLVASFLADNVYIVLSLTVIPGLLFNVYLGTTIATTHSLVGARMRATASAVLFLILNIIGLGLGPSSVGLLSDYYEPSMGVESLRYAMLSTIPLAVFLSAVCFFNAAKTLRQDIAKAPA
jgi:predicted MFS family arabinose efflux permease